MSEDIGRAVMSHGKCAGLLAEAYRGAAEDTARLIRPGVTVEGRVIVSTLRMVAPGYRESVIKCPHGIHYWTVPDAEMQTCLERLFAEAVE